MLINLNTAIQALESHDGIGSKEEAIKVLEGLSELQTQGIHMTEKTKNDNRPPDWLLSKHRVTHRGWKVLKRRQLEAIRIALNEYRNGCFYTPDDDGEVGKMQHAVNSLKEKLSVRNWGR